MKQLIFLLIFLTLASLVEGQISKGRLVVEKINAASLKNSAGENPVRKVTIYLPPGYDKTTDRYPVIYYLHAFSMSDSLTLAYHHVDQGMDKAISSGKIRPVIMVLPNQQTLFGGSYYTNSAYTGNWADFTAKELVNYIDSHFRTIPARESRAVSGHSMGGYGAIKLGMLFPDVFSSVYALSPLLAMVKEMGPHGQAYKLAQQAKTKEELQRQDVLANAVVAMGRTFSPNPAKPPFYADLPFSYRGDSLVVDYKVLSLWQKQFPLEMIEDNISNLKKLKALKLDWGRNEEYPGIPLSCQMFSQKLENYGINHFAEEYIGKHYDKLWTDDGRALHDMLPFFNTYLTFQPANYNTKPNTKRTKKK